MATATNHERDLHKKLLVGDPTATSRIFTYLYDQTVDYLKSKQPFQSQRDLALLEEAVSDALLSYFERPQIFNPEKNTLAGFFRMAAHRDLLNLIDKESRRKKKMKKVVELDDDNRNEVIEDSETPEAILRNRESDAILSEVFPNKIDREIANLILSGERETAEYASILEIEDLDSNEQRQVVKRNKDRIKKRLERFDFSKIKKQFED